MLVELMTTPRSRIEEARTWTEIEHLARKWESSGPRDIVVAGDLRALRMALDDAGIDHTARTRIHLRYLPYRIDRTVIGARLRIRKAGDVGRAREIAQDLGVLVVADDDGASPV